MFLDLCGGEGSTNNTCMDRVRTSRETTSDFRALPRIGRCHRAAFLVAQFERVAAVPGTRSSSPLPIGGSEPGPELSNGI